MQKTKGGKNLVANRIRGQMRKRGISIYRLAKLTGIRYELLRRVFCGERKLTADELVLILEKIDIKFDDVK